ncbi:MAG: FkbM family methyltransferase [Candidatus Taylorbacteria bacterium]
MKLKIPRAIKIRLYYIKNYKKGFNLIFLFPGFLRDLIGNHCFFKALIKNSPDINIDQSNKNYLLLRAGKYNLKFPNKCFYEGDFFDIMYPNLHVDHPPIQSCIYDNPFYESEGVYEKFGSILSKGDYVIDAGANVGMFSIIADDKVGNTGKVFAFEPLKEISDILKENLEKNNCKNTYIENLILGEKNADIKFYYNLEKNYNASSKLFHTEDDKNVSLRQITLDEFVKERNIQRIDFIKADIEGAERDLLNGAKEVIRKFRPKISIRTYHLPDDPQILEDIIKKLVPEYNIVQSNKTLYAWI